MGQFLLRCMAAAGCLLAGCVPPLPDITPEAPVALAVITWNMGAGRGDLGRLTQDLATSALTGQAAADYILLLQEAGEQGVRTVAASRALSVTFAAVRLSEPAASGNAILATLQLEQPRAIALPQERQPRSVVIAEVVSHGERLFVASAHLENRLGLLRGLFGDQARHRQAQALLRALPAGRPGILGGDMNTMLGPEEPALRTLLQRFPETPPDPEPTFRERLVLDHLFLDLPEGWTVSRRVLADTYGSDHHPVIATITARAR